MQKCPRNRTVNETNSSFELNWAKSQTKSVLFFTKYSIFIVDVKSGRFMYESGRAGDEPKKRKSPANNNNNNIFISYIKYTNITPPANSKANRGRWCVDGLRFITKS